MVGTRRQVVQGWTQIARRLVEEGQRELSEDVQRFVSCMPPPRTDRERVAKELSEHVQSHKIKNPEFVR